MSDKIIDESNVEKEATELLRLLQSTPFFFPHVPKKDFEEMAKKLDLAIKEGDKEKLIQSVISTHNKARDLFNSGPQLNLSRRLW